MTPYGNNGLYLGNTATGASATIPAKGTLVSIGFNDGSANQNTLLSEWYTPKNTPNVAEYLNTFAVATDFY